MSTKVLEQPLQVKRIKSLAALNSYVGVEGEPVVNMTGSIPELRICDGETVGGQPVIESPFLGVSTPQLLLPLNDSFDMSPEFNLSIDDFYSIKGDGTADTHAATVWQLSTDSDFNTIDFELESTTYLLELPSSEFIDSLDNQITYYWRARFKATLLNYSGWSSSNSLSVLKSFIVTPILTSPNNSATNVSRPAELIATPFTTSPEGSDIVVRSEWQIARDSNFTVGLIQRNKTSTTNLLVETLNYSTTYYWRMRYVGQDLGFSEWSNVRSFTVQAAPSASLNELYIQSLGNFRIVNDGSYWRLFYDLVVYYRGNVSGYDTLQISRNGISSVFGILGFEIGNTLTKFSSPGPGMLNLGLSNSTNEAQARAAIPSNINMGISFNFSNSTASTSVSGSVNISVPNESSIPTV